MAAFGTSRVNASKLQARAPSTFRSPMPTASRAGCRVEERAVPCAIPLRAHAGARFTAPRDGKPRRHERCQAHLRRRGGLTIVPPTNSGSCFLDKAPRGCVWASVTCLALHRRAQGSGPGEAYVHDNVFLALTTGENSQSPYQAGSCRHFPPLSPTVRSNQRERRVSQWSHGLTSGRPVVELGRPSP